MTMATVTGRSFGILCAMCVWILFATTVARVASAQDAGCDQADAQSDGVRVKEDYGHYFLIAKLGSMTEWSLLVQSRHGLASPVVSNDGHRLAYLSMEFGRWRAFLQRLETGYRVETAVFTEKPRRICFSGDDDSLIAIDSAGRGGVISIKKAWMSLN